MKTLIINTHPEYESNDNFSQKLMDMFVEKYNEKFGPEGLEVIDLYEEEIPRISKDMLNMWNAQRTKSPMTDSQKKIEKRQNEIL